MYKESYEKAKLDIVVFRTEDVITTSNTEPTSGENELPIIGGN